MVSSNFSKNNYETRNQLQEENGQKHKHMKIKQHPTKKPVDQLRNKGEKSEKKTFDTNENKAQLSKISWM